MCIRDRYDIIDKLNFNNQEGLLLLIDFEKPFDSVEWNFLDTFFLLDGTQTLLSQCLDTLEVFGECSGLKVNVEKTKAVWLDSKRFSKDIFLPEKNLAWVFNEPFDILGITFFCRNPANSGVQLQNEARGSQKAFRLMVLETFEYHRQNTGH